MQTPYKVFISAIPNILESGSKPHREIAYEIKKRYPEFCNDSILCTHEKKPSVQTEWNHQVRNAEQGLKRKYIIKHNKLTGNWELI